MSERRYRARIDVRLDANVNDPQGNAVRGGLQAIGYQDVGEVRIGKIVEFSLEATDADQAHARVEQMCHELLANPTIESFQILIDKEEA